MFRNTMLSALLFFLILPSSAFAFRIEHATVTLTSSVCTIVNGSTGFTASSRVSVGKCDLTVAGFSNTPTCTTSIDDQASAGSARTSSGSSTSTNVRVVTVDIDSALADYNFNILCMGE